MKKIANLRTILFLALSLIAGITFSFGIYTQNLLVWLSVITLFIVLAVFYLLFGFKIDKTKVILSLLFVIFFILGSFSFFNTIKNYEKADLNNHIYSVEGKITSFSEGENYGFAIISDCTLKGVNGGHTKYKILAYITYSEGSEFHKIGDIVEFESVLTDYKTVFEDRLSASYISENIKYNAQLNCEDIKVIGNNKTFFEKANLFIKDTLKSGLSEKEFSVAYALLTGNSDYIDIEILSSYRNTGIAHIFAVSGLHIGFLATVLAFCFKGLRINSFIKSIIITLCLFMYSGVCGFSSSSLRASIMCAVFYMSYNLGERYDPLSSTALACIIILLYSPFSLFTAGFLLSFTVVSGILLLSPLFMTLLSRLPYKLRSSLSAVLSAQIVSIPLLIKFFGSFSLISVMTNLLFIPLVCVIFIMTFSCMLIGGIFNIAKITLFCPSIILKAVNYLIPFFDKEIFMISGIVLGGFIVVYYSVVILASGIINLNKVIKTVSCVFLSAIFITGSCIMSINENKRIYMYTYATDSMACVLIRDREENYLVINKLGSKFSLLALEKVLEKSDEVNIDYVILTSDSDKDIQIAVSGLWSLIKPKCVYYFGEERQDEKQAVERSFDIPIINLRDKQTIELKAISFEFFYSGKGVKCEINGQNLLIFGKIAYTDKDYSGFYKCDIAVCFNNSQGIFNAYLPKDIISQTLSESYKNTVADGVIKFNFGKRA